MKPFRTNPFLATLAAGVASALSALASGAVEPSFRYYRPDNTGLPGDSVLSILLDGQDRPYVAAFMLYWEEGGLGFHDGDHWNALSSFDHPVITSPRFQDMEWDSAGRIWIATDGGLLRYDPAVGPSSLVRFDKTNSPLIANAIGDLDVAPDGTVWLAVAGASGEVAGGLVRFDPATSTWTTWTTATGLPWPAPWDAVHQVSVVPDAAGPGYTVYFYSREMGVARLDDGVFSSYGRVPPSSPTEMWPWRIMSDSAVDADGGLWMMTNQGFARLARDGSWTIAGWPAGVGGTDFARLAALRNNRCALGTFHSRIYVWENGAWSDLGSWGGGDHTYAIAEDSTGAIWAGGIGGCAKYENGAWSRHRITNESMTGYDIDAIEFSSDGLVYLNGNAGPGIGGFNIFDGVRWTGVNNHNYGRGPVWGLNSDDVVSFTMRQSGVLALAPGAIGSFDWNGAGYTRLTPEGWSITHTTEDALGRLWAIIASNNGILRVTGQTADRFYSANSPIPGTSLRNVEPDPNAPGFVWICGAGSLIRTDGSNWTITPKANLGLAASSDTLWHVAPRRDGKLWVGSNRGLHLFDPATGQTTTYTPANSGLAAAPVTNIEIAPDGSVWAGCFNLTTLAGGLSHFDGAVWSTFSRTNSPIRHNQIFGMNSRPVAGGYELWAGTGSEGVAVLTVHTAQPCPADFNRDGAVSLQDLFEFLGAYFASSSAADIDGSGAVGVQDIFDFLAAYFAGCP